MKIEYLTWVLVIIIIILFAVLAWILIAFIRKLINGSAGNTVNKLIALAVTGFLFNYTISRAIFTFVSFLISCIGQLTAGTNLQSQATPFSEKKVLDNSEPLKQLISGLPIAALISMLSFGVLFYYLLAGIGKSRSISSEQTPGKPNFLKYNLFICSVLLFSLFLVISVFITIPYLNEARKPTIFTKARLDSAMNDIPERDSSFMVKTSPGPFADSSIKTLVLTDTLRNIYQKLKPADKQSIDNSISNMQREINNSQLQRNRVLNVILQYARDYKTEDMQMRKLLSGNFEVASQSLTSDKGALYNMALNLYRLGMESRRTGFTSTVDHVNAQDQYNEGLKQSFVAKVQQDIIRLKDRNINDSLTDIITVFYGRLGDYYSYIPTNQLDAWLPSFNKNGSDWGFFGYIAKYLIQTESSELVLLIGMFGFGLLGASILSFRKSTESSNTLDSLQNEPLIHNFFNVLARGFGAALIVYLATKGGLAIFSLGSTSDPNGYILLLTCFIAAVYSERVWNKVSGSFDKPGDTKKQEADQQPEGDKTKETPEPGTTVSR
ncbi:MAG: hypothetical protein JWQ30_1574 [Sediminibacterium sp.]|nr:hypothetical protein [Sediminibacterium sp.]